MAVFTVNWENGPMALDVPDANIRTVVTDPKLPVLDDPLALVRKALDRPIGCPPIEDAVKPGDRVALLITDTKDGLLGPPHGIGPFLLDRLNAAGIPDSRITLVHTAGMHGHAGARKRLGDGWLHRIRYVEHHPWNDDDLAYLGTTQRGTPIWVNRHVAEADYTLGIGGCHPSLFGYHGGAGIILPGAAGRDTIHHNHSFILADRPLACWGPGNPMREDVQDAGDLAGLNMKIDFTANTVFAGYHREEWPKALRYLQQHTMTPVEPADIYILAPDPSGHLLSFYMKIEMSEQVLHPHGICILVVSGAGQPKLTGLPVEDALRHTLECTEAWMKSTYAHPVAPPPGADDTRAKLELMRLSLPELARIVSKKLGEPRSTTMSWSHKRSILRRRTFLVTETIDEEDAATLGFVFRTTSFREALDKALRELGRDAHILVNAPAYGTPLPPQNRV
ncbi:MAG: DUF2088 domain-containing protein [candidate division Zixibacteria bacterium]|nr:DUF2088 domain-containing protein [candidate division Zixibacteria bacterium]